MKVLRKQLVGVVVSAGADKIFAWAPIPEGGKLLSVTGALHVVSANEGVGLQTMKGYGVSGELAPVQDPDSVDSLDVLWDHVVTKPTELSLTAATPGLDWDWDTSDTGPDVEPGEVDINTMINALSPTKEIMAPRLEVLSYAKSVNGTFRQVDSATDEWVPTDYKTYQSRRRLVAENGPAYAMLAFSSPTFDREETTPSEIVNNVKEWTMLANLRSIMQDMWKMQMGGTEAGAIEPYRSASELIEHLVAPDIVQPGSEILASSTWTVFAETTWLLDLPEQAAIGMLKADNG
jgi:hypothetical protein